MEKATRDIYNEWGCRILLSVHVLFTIAGYINYSRTKHQLISPLIPQSTIIEIAEPALLAGKYMGGLLLVSLWLYFFRKRFACIIFSSISLTVYSAIESFFTRG